MLDPTKDYSALETLIGYTFQDKELLEKIFVHRSYLNEHNDEHLESNERLEFLGDAVLELVVTEFLFKKYPEMSEGELTAIRSAVVRRDHLAGVARDLSLGKYLFMSKGEERSGGEEKDYILANTVESLLGGVYMECDYTKCKELITQFVLKDVETIVEEKSYIDSKSLLQEKAQELLCITPHYDVLKQEGPDHDKRFVMGVYLGAELIGEGNGSSKRKAEEQAAFEALQKKGWM